MILRDGVVDALAARLGVAELAALCGVSRAARAAYEPELHRRLTVVAAERVDGSQWMGWRLRLAGGDEILLVIDTMYQRCCEEVGTDMVAPDGLEPSGLVGARVTHARMATTSERPFVYEGGSDSVIVDTTAGRATLSVWNQHNGYYEHDAVAIIVARVREFSL